MSLQERWTGLRTTSISDFITNPKYFKLKLDGIIEEPSSPAQKVGTVTHSYLLEYEDFKNTYIFLDYTKPTGANQLAFCEYIAKQIKKDNKKNKKDLSIEGYKLAYKTTGKSDNKIEEEAEKLYKQLEDYIKFLTLESGKEVISYSLYNYVKQAHQSVVNHKLASKLMYKDELTNEEHYNETFVLWEFPKSTVHGIPLVIKSTIDKLIIDHDNKIIKLVDLKTTNDIGNFDNKFHEYNSYKIQLACYWFAVETYFRELFPDKNINEYTRETYLVAIQTSNPYRDYPVNCEVWPISEKSLAEGLNILEKTLPDLAWHFENDLWDHHRIYYEGDGSQLKL